jgi:nucleotide-binding universal stress UspA family protein
MSWKLDPNRPALLPFDFSAPATDALATARGLVASTDLLWVLHVVPPVSTTSPGFLMGQVDPAVLRQRADTALAKALSEAELGEAQRRIAIGDPASEIIDVARAIDAGVIVIPSRGKSGLRRWMIGSVAEKVVRQAPCPVLVLPIFLHDDEKEQ